MSQDVLREIIDAYPIVTDDVLKNSHILKTVSDASKFPQSPRIMRLYTDGSCLLNEDERKELANQGKRSSFSGWGYTLKRISGAEPEPIDSQHGHVHNGSTLLAELSAIREGLKAIDKPAVVSVVTDSRHAIQMLLSADQVKQDYEKMARNDSLGSLRARELRAALEVSDMLKQRNVLHAEVSWVKSHVSDHIPKNKLPSLSDVSDGSERITLMDIYGNREADNCAKKGARAAIREALNLLKIQESGFDKEFLEVDKITRDQMLSRSQKQQAVKKLVPHSERGKKWRDMLKSVDQVAENLKAHGGARNEAIRVMSKMPEDSLSNWTMSQLFTNKDLDRISALRRDGEGEEKTLSEYGKKLNDAPDEMELKGSKDGYLSTIGVRDDAKNQHSGPGTLN